MCDSVQKYGIKEAVDVKFIDINTGQEVMKYGFPKNLIALCHKERVLSAEEASRVLGSMAKLPRADGAIDIKIEINKQLTEEGLRWAISMVEKVAGLLGKT